MFISVYLYYIVIHVVRVMYIYDIYDITLVSIIQLQVCVEEAQNDFQDYLIFHHTAFLTRVWVVRIYILLESSYRHKKLIRFVYVTQWSAK